MPQPTEQPWMPSTPKGMPFDITLASPNGTRHLAFDNATGRWYRLWQNRAPEALHTGEAIFLRPSDVDQIVKFTNIWSVRNPDNPRMGQLIDELADGVKQLVLHFANQAGAS